MRKERSKRDKEFDELWEKSKKVTVKRPPPGPRMTRISIEIEKEMLRALVDRAREKGVSTGTLARELIGKGLQEEP